MAGSGKKILTAYNVQGTECNVAEAVKWFSAYMFQHLLGQNITLLIHNLQEVSENRKVKCRGQHFASTAPLVSCTAMCGRQIMNST